MAAEDLGLTRIRIEVRASSEHTRDLYQVPGVAETVNLDHIRRHYYISQDNVNPSRLVARSNAVPRETSGDVGVRRRLALRGGHWTGFCYLSLWDAGRFLSTSALIVPPAFRGLGTGRSRWLSRFVRFGTFNLICVAGIAFSALLLNVQVYWLHLDLYLANFISIVAVSFWNFLMNLRFGWRSGLK